VLPSFYHERIRRELGPLYEYQPDGALYHDQNAYLDSTAQAPVEPVPLRSRAG
jgi:hypothetical protein